MVSDGSKTDHPVHNARRKVQFVERLEQLRSKLGSAGQDNGRQDHMRGQAENNQVDFPPLAAIWIASLKDAIEHAKGARSGHSGLIAEMLRPALKLKEGASACGYPLVVRLADTLIRFLRALVRPDKDSLDVVVAFHAAIDAVVTARITGFGGKHGDELLDGLVAACRNYFKNHPENRSRQ